MTYCLLGKTLSTHASGIMHGDTVSMTGVTLNASKLSLKCKKFGLLESIVSKCNDVSKFFRLVSVPMCKFWS